MCGLPGRATAHGLAVHAATRRGGLLVTTLGLGSEVLDRAPRLDQRAVDAEVVRARQAGLTRLLDDRLEEVRRDFVLDQAVTVLREGRRVEDLLDHVHVEEPPVEHVVLDLLAELPLAADRVQHLQKDGLQEPLRRDRAPARAGVDLVEERRQALQSRVGEGLERSQRVVLPDPVLDRDQAEHRRLLRSLASHEPLRSHRRGSCRVRISTAC